MRVNLIERRSIIDYLSGEETLRRQELVWGIVREPPAPYCSHQSLVTHATVLLAMHVASHNLGRVLVSPVDVVLDGPNALVLQPDVVYVSTERLNIVRDRIWGAPDLVVEVLSPGTRRRDLVDKRRWYRQYGVREYWIVDPITREIVVLAFDEQRVSTRRRFAGNERIVSAILPSFDASVAAFFEDVPFGF